MEKFENTYIYFEISSDHLLMLDILMTHSLYLQAGNQNLISLSIFIISNIRTLSSSLFLYFTYLIKPNQTNWVKVDPG